MIKLIEVNRVSIEFAIKEFDIKLEFLQKTTELILDLIQIKLSWNF